MIVVFPRFSRKKNRATFSLTVTGITFCRADITLVMRSWSGGLSQVIWSGDKLAPTSVAHIFFFFVYFEFPLVFH